MLAGLAVCAGRFGGTASKGPGLPEVGNGHRLTAFEDAWAGGVGLGIHRPGFEQARSAGLTAWYVNRSTSIHARSTDG
jgi:hypothetical protein